MPQAFAFSSQGFPFWDHEIIPSSTQIKSKRKFPQRMPQAFVFFSQGFPFWDHEIIPSSTQRESKRKFPQRMPASVHFFFARSLLNGINIVNPLANNMFMFLYLKPAGLPPLNLKSLSPQRKPKRNNECSQAFGYIRIGSSFRIMK